MSCRIDRVLIGEDLVVLCISGRITGQDVDMLRTLLERERSAGAIDLKDVRLADREAVKLLALCESRGTELRNCPAYVREWVTKERAEMHATNVIKILSVDHHHLIREGIAAVIGNQRDMKLVAQASSGTEAIERYRQHRPDVTLMDLRLPGLSGIDATMAIRAEFPQARILILTTFDGDVEVQCALKAGVCGYFLKSQPAEELIRAIREVHAGNKSVQAELAAQIAEHMGEDSLSTREIEILEHIAAGRRNREIGERLFISEGTVKTHLRHIMVKLGARDRTHALVIAHQRGFVRI